MSGNNPNLNYALNVLGNATVTGILDCGEVSIDLVDTEDLVVTKSGTSGRIAEFTMPAATGTSYITIGKDDAAAGKSIVIAHDAASDTGSIEIGGLPACIQFNNTGITLARNTSVTGNVTVSGLTASLPVSTNGSKQLVTSSVTGTGSTVLQTSPSLTTPNIGSAAGTLLALTGPFSSNSVSSADLVISKPVVTSGIIAEFAMPAATTSSYITIGKDKAAAGKAVLITHDTTTDTGSLEISGLPACVQFNNTVITLARNTNISGKITAVRNVSIYNPTADTGILTGILNTDPQVNWIPSAGFPDGGTVGDALTYTNGDGRFTNNLGRTVYASITYTCKATAGSTAILYWIFSSTAGGKIANLKCTSGDDGTVSANVPIAAGSYIMVGVSAEVVGTMAAANASLGITLL